MSLTVIDLIVLVLFAEALVELICKAEILDRPRQFVQSLSSFTSRLLECSYCTSVWIGFFTVTAAFWIVFLPVKLFVYALAIHRASNYVHLIFSLLRDYQLDVRINRNKEV